MNKYKHFDDVELVWACKSYCEGKHHIDSSFIEGVWQFLVARDKITEKQRDAVIRFVKREKIDVEKWKGQFEDSGG
jgi:hypothetical protein